MKYFVFLFWMCTNLAWAKIQIHAHIDQYKHQDVFLYGYINNTEYLLEKVQTDEQGDFTYESPKDYDGIIRLFFAQPKIQAIVFYNNEPISFDAQLDAKKVNFVFKNSEANTIFNTYQNSDSYQEKVELLNTLQGMYTSQDTFYKAINTEKKRLDSEYTIHLDKYPFVQYFVNLEQKYLNYQPKDEKDALRISNEILTHLVQDNEDLEKSTLMSQLLNIYLTYEVNQYTTSEEQIAAIRTTIDTVLDQTLIETSRGQNVLVGFINILRGYGLDYMADEYIEKAQALTCTITDELKSTISSSENTQVGATLENFTFTQPIQGKKSLYDIKSHYKLVIFWGSFCPHCKEEKPLLEAYYPEFKSKGGEIISFGIESNQKEYENFVKDVPWFTDSDLLYWTSPIVSQYGIQGTPTIFLLDENNTIIAKGAKLSFLMEKIK